MTELRKKSVKILALPEFAVRHPVTVVMVYGSLLILSLVALSRMRLDMFPDVTFPTLTVLTTYQGAGAQEVEEKITKPVESSVSIVRNLKELQSSSTEGLSTVTLKFEWGINLDNAANDVRDKLGFIRRLIPDAADDPMILRFDMKDMPVLFLGAGAEESYPKIYNILNTDVSNMLKRVPGVGNIIIRGGMERQINLDVDRRRLEAYGLTLLDVRAAVGANNVTTPAGDLKVGRTDFLLRVPGEFESPEEIADAVVGVSRGRPIKIRDVADVRDSHPEETEKVVVNGRRGAMVLIQKRGEANTIEVADAVKKMIPEIRAKLPKDVTFDVIMDTSKDIRKTLANLTDTMKAAVVLIFGVILLFLRRVRPALIVFTSIPISILDSFMLQYLFGYTINMISLLALTIAVGLVVDDALVVMENQIRRQEELGEDPRTAAVNAASEVGRAVTMSTLTSCVVFLPMIFATGIAGVMFRQLAIVMVITLLLSLFDSLTLNPMLSSIFLRSVTRREASSNAVFRRADFVLAWIEHGYRRLIVWALGHRKKVVIGASVVFFLTLCLTPLVGTSFLPNQDSGQFNAVFELPVGSRVEATHEVMEKAEAGLRKAIPAHWLTATFWRDGLNPKQSMGSFSKEGVNIGTLMAVLVDKDKRSMGLDDINEQFRKLTAKIPGITRASYLSGDMGAQMLGNEKPMIVNVFGYDLNASYAFAEKIKKLMEETPGFRDESISLDLTRPEIHVVIDRRKAGAMGVPVQSIADTVNLAFAQQKTGVYREKGDEYDIVIRLRPEDRRTEPDLENLFVRTPAGGVIRLSNLARFEKVPGPLQIDRQDQQRIIKVDANIVGGDLGGLTKVLKKKLSKLPLPAGIALSFGGSVKEQQESFRNLFLALLLGIMLTYMVMASQFESFTDPFIIMFSLPYGFVGAIWVFVLTGFTLNIGTFIGLIMMVGLVVKQAIVYLDYALQLIDEEWPTHDALIEAGRVRLRPILMTVTAMIFGLLPMALSTKAGSEFWQPLSLSVMGGLAVSTVVTLVLIPVLYSLVSEKFGR
jgi:HAE1 family hydrophobic/amphiphilic exporter-1